MLKPARLHFISLLMPLIPQTRCWALKRALYRFCGAKIEKNVHISSSVRILGNSELVIKANTWLSPGSYISCTSNIIIEENCDIGPQCYIGTGTHHILHGQSKAAGRGLSLPIIIKRGCWIGARTIILPNITIGECSICAAGSLVNKNVPPRSLVGGVPIRELKRL